MSADLAGQDLRAAAAKLRDRYAKQFDVPKEFVRIHYYRHSDCRDDADVTCPSVKVRWSVNGCAAVGCCKPAGSTANPEARGSR